MQLINIFTCWQVCGCCKRGFIARRRERYDKYQKAKVKLAEEFDLLELIKRVRILSMLTTEIFAQRQSIFVCYADKFHISLVEEPYKPGKPPDVLTVDELAEILEDFDPIHNLEDKKLVHFLAGRRIPEEELRYLVQQAKASDMPDNQQLRRLTRSLAFGLIKSKATDPNDSFRFNSMHPG